jgi:energy-coupling factor transporter ATP-binding protein EcfA2
MTVDTRNMNKGEIMIYKGDQPNGIKCLHKSVNNGEKDTLLIGYAGTGKTTLIDPLLGYLLGYRFKVLVAAPTHRAKKVILSKLTKNVKTCTIHSALGLIVDESIDSCVETQNTHMRNYDWVLIDESSMLSNELMDYIEKKRGKARIIYFGDPLQLPSPGDKNISRCFNVKNSFEMRKPIRTSDTNPELNAATNIRENISSNEVVKIEYDTTLNKKGEGTHTLSVEETIDGYAAVLDSGGDPKILCYQNNDKDDWNNAIRERIIKDHKSPYVSGEKMIMDAPMASVIQNGQEFTVKKVLEEETILGVETIKALIDIEGGNNIIINLPKNLSSYKRLLDTTFICICYYCSQKSRLNIYTCVPGC